MQSTAYRPDIDGLRALSILAVLAYHGFPSLLPGGFVGVDVFFVISGYLITGLILAELERSRFSFTSFYFRRIRRIFPALALVLIAVYVAGWNIFFPAEFKQLGRHIAGAAAFIPNFVLLYEQGYFDIAANAKPLLHIWSLGVEEQFYLIWPLFVWLLCRGKSHGLVVTFVVLLASLALGIYYYSTSTAFYSPVARLWELATGALIAEAQQTSEGTFPRVKHLVSLLSEKAWLRLRDTISIAGVTMIGLAVYITPFDAFPGYWALLPVVGSTFILCAGRAGWVNRNVLGLGPMVFIGLISYPLYLWHWPPLSFAWIIYGGTPPVAVTCVILAMSFVLAWLTFVLIERPIRSGAKPGLAAAGLVATIVVVGSVGLWTADSTGLPDRQVAQVNRQLAEDLEVPTKTRESDGSCREYFGGDKEGGRYSSVHIEDVEICLASSAKPRFVVIGDSHAMAMYSGIYAGVAHQDAMMISGNLGQACLTPGAFDVWLQGRSSCQNAVRALLALLVAQPSIEAVVFVASQFNPFFGDREKFGDVQNAILALGKRVVWMVPVPTLESPLRCLPRKLSLLGVDLTIAAVGNGVACRMERTVIARGATRWTNHIEAMTHGRNNVYVYDPLPLFCDAEYCRQNDDRGELYWILGHLNVRGSARLLDGFLPWLRANVLSAN